MKIVWNDTIVIKFLAIFHFMNLNGDTDDQSVSVSKLREFVEPLVIRPWSYWISKYLQLYRILHLLWGK